MSEGKYGFHRGEDYLEITENGETIALMAHPTAPVIKRARKIIIALNSQSELLISAKALIAHDRAADARAGIDNCLELRNLESAISYAERK